MNRLLRGLIPAVLAAAAAGPQAAGDVETTIVEFPDPAQFYLNTTFSVSGTVAFVPSFDQDRLWSFSVATGALLDADGLLLPSPGTASDAYLFPGDLAAIPGWFPGQGVYVADVSDPEDLRQAGIIPFGSGTNLQGQNIEVDDNGVVGYVASFPDDTLYSFNVDTLGLEDPDGLALPGNPDRIALAGDRLAIVDTTFGRILVVDVTDPAALVLAGIIELPGANTFNSNDNMVFAADGRTGFVSSNERVLYSFDVQTLTLPDPDGLAFGSQLYGDAIALHGSTVACIWSRGLAFVDAQHPSSLKLISNAKFGTTVAPQGSATVAFTHDGTMAAVPVVYPGNYVYTFEVATGDQVSAPLPVDDQPNFLTILGPADRVGVICSGSDADNVWLIDGLFPADGDFDGDGDVDLEDHAVFAVCLGGPGVTTPPGECPADEFERADIDGDADVDLDDFADFQEVFTGSST